VMWDIDSQARSKMRPLYRAMRDRYTCGCCDNRATAAPRFRAVLQQNLDCSNSSMADTTRTWRAETCGLFVSRRPRRDAFKSQRAVGPV